MSSGETTAERVTQLLHCALLMQTEPGDSIIGRGSRPRDERMVGEEWIDADDRIKGAEGSVAEYGWTIEPADLTAVARAFRITAAVDAWRAVEVENDSLMATLDVSSVAAEWDNWRSSAERVRVARKTLIAALGGGPEGSREGA